MQTQDNWPPGALPSSEHPKCPPLPVKEPSYLGFGFVIVLFAESTKALSQH